MSHAISNHWQLNHLFNRSSSSTAKKSSKFYIYGLLWGESPTKGQWCRKHFHVHVSSCVTPVYVLVHLVVIGLESMIKVHINKLFGMTVFDLNFKFWMISEFNWNSNHSSQSIIQNWKLYWLNLIIQLLIQRWLSIISCTAKIFNALGLGSCCCNPKLIIFKLIWR